MSRPASTKLNLRTTSQFSVRAITAFGLVFVAIGGYAIYRSSHAATSCTTNVTTNTFAAAVSSALAGQTLCMASGSYGSWLGTNKAITVTPQTGATVTMTIEFGSSVNGPTIDGLGGMGGDITAGAKNITIKNSAFTSALAIDGVVNANILIDHNTSTNVDVGSSCQGTPAHFWIGDSNGSPTGVTVSNNIISGGDADGVRADSQLSILNNEIYNVYENGPNDCAHTDGIQFYGGEGVIIKGNYIHNASDGIVAYDGTANNDIENNIINLVDGRYGIELYSDKNSIVKHNTLVYGTGCSFDPCGGIYLDHKSSDPAGTGTVVADNIASIIDTSNGSIAASNTHNMLHSGAAGNNFNGIPVYSGGASPSTFAGFVLSNVSPGHSAASDASDVGISGSGANMATLAPTVAPTATPVTTTTPTATPTSLVGDANADHHVNLTDLSIVLSHWNVNYAAADFNHDGVVNLTDLSMILSHWTG